MTILKSWKEGQVDRALSQKTDLWFLISRPDRSYKLVLSVNIPNRIKYILSLFRPIQRLSGPELSRSKIHLTTSNFEARSDQKMTINFNMNLITLINDYFRITIYDTEIEITNIHQEVIIDLTGDQKNMKSLK